MTEIEKQELDSTSWVEKMSGDYDGDVVNGIWYKALLGRRAQKRPKRRAKSRSVVQAPKKMLYIVRWPTVVVQNEFSILSTGQVVAALEDLKKIVDSEKAKSAINN